MPIWRRRSFSLIFPDIHAVQKNSAAVHIVKSGNQAAQSSLAASGGTHDGDIVPGVYVKVNMAQHSLLSLFISEGYIIKLHLSPGRVQTYSVRRVRDIRLHRQNLQEALIARVAVLELLCKGDQLFLPDP